MRKRPLLTGGTCGICGYADGFVLLSWHKPPKCESCAYWALEFDKMPQPIPATIGSTRR